MTPNNSKDQDLPLMVHLIELRDRLIKAAIAVILCALICFYFSGEIWNFLVAPLNQALEETGKGTMAVHNVFEGIITQLKIAFLAGALLASPIVSYQIWQFIFPALTDEEVKMVAPLSFFSSILFLLGVSFGYFVIFQFVFPFFLSVTGDDIEAVLSINSYLNTATKLLLSFGLSFQLPVGIFFLARIGLIDHIDLLQFFRYAIVVIAIVSAFLTPPDPLSQLLMAAPLLVLYGIGIVISYFASTKTREDTEHSESPD